MFIPPSIMRAVCMYHKKELEECICIHTILWCLFLDAHPHGDGDGDRDSVSAGSVSHTVLRGGKIFLKHPGN